MLGWPNDSGSVFCTAMNRASSSRLQTDAPGLLRLQMHIRSNLQQRLLAPRRALSKHVHQPGSGMPSCDIWSHR